MYCSTCTCVSYAAQPARDGVTVSSDNNPLVFLPCPALPRHTVHCVAYDGKPYSLIFRDTHWGCRISHCSTFAGRLLLWQVATALINLGRVLDDKASYAEALAHLRNGLSIRERLLGERHPDTITALAWVGVRASARIPSFGFESGFVAWVFSRAAPAFAALVSASTGALSNLGSPFDVQCHRLACLNQRLASCSILGS